MKNLSTAIKIDDEFRDLIPPLSPQEQVLLEESVIRYGCRDALLVWEEKGILLDGHNRHSICEDHGIEFEVKGLSFDDRSDALHWMIRNQLGRRNISSYDRARLALKLEPFIAERAKQNCRSGGGDQKSEASRSGLQNSANPIDTRKELAKSAGVSHDTIAKVKLIEAEGSEELKTECSLGETSINAAYKKVRRGKSGGSSKPKSDPSEKSEQETLLDCRSAIEKAICVALGIHPEISAAIAEDLRSIAQGLSR
ncbi:MAG: hypothetical protein KDB53_07315 [Planctomycetes bacterium]|nr:hypothetical protein [Planctomycetota bacterium]